MFTAVTSEALTDRITTAKTRIVFVGPGVTEDVSKALVEAHHRSVFVTVILDLDQDAYRIGFGDPEGLTYLREHGSTVRLYRQAGTRIGLLLADEVLTIWSPTPRSVENDRREGQPNAIVLDGRIIGDSLGNDVIESLKNEEIGGAPIRPDELETVVAKLERDPPTPFDLARKVRVFSTRFQFVEATLRGAEYTPRRIRISSLLLNADLPKNLQDVLETQIRPFKAMEGVAIDAPHIIRGQIAYNQHGKKILVPMTEADVGKSWEEIKKRYLFEIQGFGSLIRKADLVWCLTNTLMKMRGDFGCRQGAMTCRGDRRSPPWWRAPREEDPGSSPERRTQPTAKRTRRFVSVFVRHHTSVAFSYCDAYRGGSYHSPPTPSPSGRGLG